MPAHMPAEAEEAVEAAATVIAGVRTMLEDGAQVFAVGVHEDGRTYWISDQPTDAGSAIRFGYVSLRLATAWLDACPCGVDHGPTLQALQVMTAQVERILSNPSLS